METKSKYEALDFQSMVKIVAEDALLELVSGTKWESIFYTAATKICAWRMAQSDIKRDARIN